MKPTFKRLFLASFAIITLSIISSGCSTQEEQKVSDTRFAMDTFIKIDAYTTSPGEARLALDDAMQGFQKVAAETDRFSGDDKQSLFYANNHAAYEPVQVSKHLGKLLTFNNSKNNTMLDISIAPIMDLWQKAREQNNLPNESELNEILRHVGRDKYSFEEESQQLSFSDSQTKLDLGAIAKGYAVDVAAETLLKHKAITCALVNAGGNIKAIGNKPGNKPWRVAVQHPRKAEKFLGTIALSNGQAAATSGDYQRYYELDGVRYHHLIDPQTGQPVWMHQSVTVIAMSGLKADYYSTLFFLLPTPAILDYLKQDSELGVIIVEENGSTVVSNNLQKIWQPAQDI